MSQINLSKTREGGLQKKNKRNNTISISILVAETSQGFYLS